MLSQFKTQQQLKSYVFETISRIGICKSIKTQYPADYCFFLKLFERHPAYPDKMFGMIDLQIGINPKFKNKELQIVYTNGEIKDISYNLCITGRPKNALKIAMRVAVQPQIDEFRNKSKLQCEFCDSVFGLEVDHIKWFEQLYQEFINTGQELPTIFNETDGHQKCFRAEDAKFENEWVEYHKKYATLRILCSSCNSSRPNFKSIPVT